MPLAFGPYLFIVAALFAAQLFGDSVWEVYAINEITLRQMVVPSHLMGRANATMQFVVGGAGPIGALIAGALAQASERTSCPAYSFNRHAAGYALAPFLTPPADARSREPSKRTQGHLGPEFNSRLLRVALARLAPQACPHLPRQVTFYFLPYPGYLFFGQRLLRRVKRHGEGQALLASGMGLPR